MSDLNQLIHLSTEVFYSISSFDEDKIICTQADKPEEEIHIERAKELDEYEDVLESYFINFKLDSIETKRIPGTKEYTVSPNLKIDVVPRMGEVVSLLERKHIVVSKIIPTNSNKDSFRIIDKESEVSYWAPSMLNWYFKIIKDYHNIDGEFVSFTFDPELESKICDVEVLSSELKELYPITKLLNWKDGGRLKDTRKTKHIRVIYYRKLSYVMDKKTMETYVIYSDDGLFYFAPSRLKMFLDEASELPDPATIQTFEPLFSFDYDKPKHGERSVKNFKFIDKEYGKLNNNKIIQVLEPLSLTNFKTKQTNIGVVNFAKIDIIKTADSKKSSDTERGDDVDDGPSYYYLMLCNINNGVMRCLKSNNACNRLCDKLTRFDKDVGYYFKFDYQPADANSMEQRSLNFTLNPKLPKLSPELKNLVEEINAGPAEFESIKKLADIKADKLFYVLKYKFIKTKFGGSYIIHMSENASTMLTKEHNDDITRIFTNKKLTEWIKTAKYPETLGSSDYYFKFKWYGSSGNLQKVAELEDNPDFTHAIKNHKEMVLDSQDVVGKIGAAEIRTISHVKEGGDDTYIYMVAKTEKEPGFQFKSSYQSKLGQHTKAKFGDQPLTKFTEYSQLFVKRSQGKNSYLDVFSSFVLPVKTTSF